MSVAQRFFSFTQNMHVIIIIVAIEQIYPCIPNASILVCLVCSVHSAASSYVNKKPVWMSNSQLPHLHFYNVDTKTRTKPWTSSLRCRHLKDSLCQSKFATRLLSVMDLQQICHYLVSIIRLHKDREHKMISTLIFLIPGAAKLWPKPSRERNRGTSWTFVWVVAQRL